MRRQQLAAEASQFTNPVVNQAVEEVTSKVTRATTQSRISIHTNAPQAKHSSVSPQSIVSSLLNQKAHNNTQNPLPLLNKVREQQSLFPRTPLFPLFIRQYYAKEFGDISPHMDAFFKQLNTIRDEDIELKITKRFYFLARNKDLIGKAVFPYSHKCPFEQKNFRVRYLNNMDKITADNFDDKSLVLSIERRMTPNPYHDLPIRHINGRSTIKLDQQTYPLFFYNGPFDDLGSLYYFLLNGSKTSQKVSFVLDEDSKAMIMFNHDHTLWLRISSHEFMNPQNLHIHLNQLRSVSFTNKNGVESEERINLNLSIPLAAPMDVPLSKPSDFLYKKMIVTPVRKFKQNPDVTIEKHSFW